MALMHAGAFDPKDTYRPTFADLLKFETFRPQLLERYEQDHRLTDGQLAARMRVRHRQLTERASIQSVYDSISAAAMPNNGNPVCVYNDGAYVATAAQRARFTGPVVGISVFAGNTGTVDDCEQGNAGPASMPGWVTNRRAAGVDPTIYCGQNQWWSSIIQTLNSAGIAQPHYWVASYTYNPSAAIPAGAIGVQWTDQGGGGGYDQSNFINPWPGVQNSAPPAPTLGFVGGSN